MKLSELEQLIKKLQNVEAKYLNTIPKYLDALAKALHGPDWYRINFDEELKTLATNEEWLTKKLAECKRMEEKH